MFVEVRRGKAWSESRKDHDHAWICICLSFCTFVETRLNWTFYRSYEENIKNCRMALEMWLTCRQASSSAFQKHTICQASLWRWRHCRGKIKHYLTRFMHKTALYVFTPTCMWITSNFSWMHTVSKVWSQWARSFCCQTITYHKVGFCILERFSLFWQAFATTRWERKLFKSVYTEDMICKETIT